MALKFTTQNSNISFFPTLHIHNGNLDSQSEFDHILYLQTNSNVDSFWQKAFYSPAEKMDINNLLKGDRTKGIISAATPLYRKVLKGLLMNQDIIVAN